MQATSLSATGLKFHFIVVGGGVAGLAAAAALTRVGHRVTVLEKGDGSSNQGPGGIYVPPNMSKVLFHWGLRDKIEEVGLTTHPLLFFQYHTGQLLGMQHWDDELLRETRGEFILMTHGDLCQILHEAAASQGAEIRYNAQVVDIEPEDGEVKLASGEIMRADLIIGADGERGMCRRMVLGREERIQPSGMVLFECNPVYCAMGNGCGSTGYPIVSREIMFHQFFRGDFPLEGSYSDPPTAKAELVSLLPSEIHPTLYHGVRGADRVTRVAINIYENLEDWVHESGRLLVIGQAAHPIASGSIQVTAMAIEDAAVLGRLYQYLTIPEQASEFLYAFHDLRRQRCQDVLEGEVSMVSLITRVHGPEQEQRDNGMRAKYHAGKNVLEGDDTGGGEGEQWVTIRTIFGYDCEDEADDWWFQWGLLRARANSDGQNRQSQMGVFSWANMGIQSVDMTTMA
ncbi:FAD/NAD-P-binding domain-containing protein [Fomitopsis serialis]|uniref:FAD/NAD-P-binding domain-containing protein n=1 Tax=Fomitopsis serialis TaxID=139415 RepID=UPI0020072969|nr:FAD/NAD-P-binding domain-containing protein [Neoantrodia serialis]KAH9918837.1 FAD/NAD-P-binding domain-containing protein [Neoantrodia serialis]